MKKTLAAVLVAILVLSCCGAIFASADTAVNLAAGCTYTGADIPDVISQYNANLTDGVAADEMDYGANWFAFWYNASNPEYLEITNAPDRIGTIVVDLKEACTVDQVRLHMCVRSDINAAIASVKVEGSVDGSTYTAIGAEKTDLAENNGLGDWYEFDAENAVSARYVKVTIELVGMFGMINEIEVMGTKGVVADTSSEETSSEETSSEDASSEVDEAAAYAAAIAEKLGEAVADSAMNVALSSAVAEDGAITVTLTIDGLKDGVQVDVLEGALCYDAEKLTLTTNLEDLELTTAPDSDWETLTAPAGEGKLEFSAFTTKAKTLLTKDGKLEMSLTFTLKDGATYGAVWMENGVSAEETDLDTGAAKNTYKANGAYTVINAAPAVEDPSEDTSSEEISSAESSTTPKPGDAGIVVFALLGLVAVAGAAVVIKVRQ